jgi:LysR family transcriptional regulator, nitrogen assimilation regulatory protein
MMKLRHLRYFVTVVDAGSFSRAATTIHIAQPALSRQVLELEEIIGVELLHRTARGVRPTAAGEVLYREATTILRQMDKLPGIVRSAGGEVEGTVSLGMSSTLASFLSGPFMDACRAAFPKVRLRFITGDSILLKSHIDAGKIDLAVVYEDEPTPGYARQTLFRQRLYLVRREPLAENGAAVPIGRLAEIPLVLPAHPNVTRILLDRVFAEAGVAPNMVGEADVLSSMLSAVQTGIGDTVLPKGDLSDVPGYGALLPLPIEPAIFLTAAILNSSETPLGRTATLVRNLFAGFVFELMNAVPPPGAEWIGNNPVMPGRHIRMPT